MGFTVHATNVFILNIEMLKYTFLYVILVSF